MSNNDFTEMSDKDFTGVNKEATIELIKNVKIDSQRIRETIQYQLQNNVVNAIKDGWYAEEAVTFFNNFKECVEQASKAIAAGINTVINNVAAVYDKWLSNTGSHDFIGGTAVCTGVSEDDTKVVLSVDVIKKIGPKSQTGISVEICNNVANNLSNVRDNIKAVLDEKHQKWDATAAFSDPSHEQAKSIQDFYSAQLDVINKIFNFLTESNGDSVSLRDCINSCIEKYGQIASQNSAELKEAALGE